jgi:hypothetical protein
MGESADSSTRHQRYHVLSAATLSNDDNRKFVHMKVMVDAVHPLHSRFAKPVGGGVLFRSLFKGSIKMRIPSIVPTKERIADGWRRGTARPPPRSPLPSGGSACPAPGSVYRKSPRRFMMPRSKFIMNLPTDG